MKYIVKKYHGIIFIVTKVKVPKTLFKMRIIIDRTHTDYESEEVTG